jgi:hypothetical protein
MIAERLNIPTSGWAPGNISLTEEGRKKYGIKKTKAVNVHKAIDLSTSEADKILLFTFTPPDPQLKKIVEQVTKKPCFVFETVRNMTALTDKIMEARKFIHGEDGKDKCKLCVITDMCTDNAEFRLTVLSMLAI